MRNFEIRYYGVIIFIIICQISMFIYWGNIKTNFYIDEFYSLEDAGTFSKVGDTQNYITEGENYKQNEWIKVGDLKRYFTINDEEKIQNISFEKISNHFFTSYNYDVLLNIAYSINSGENINKWPGIILNIFFFIIGELAIISIYKELKVSKYICILSITMYGFSSFFIGLVEYIRFYTLTMMLMILMILFHIKAWKCEKWIGTICYELLGGLTLLLGIHNAQYALIFGCGFTSCLYLAAIINKKKKIVISYAIFIVFGIIYLYYKTAYIDMIFHLEKYLTTESWMGVVAENIYNSNWPWIRNHFYWFHELIGNYVFGNVTIQDVFYTIFILLVIFLLVKLGSKERGNFQMKGDCFVFAVIMFSTYFVYTIFASMALLLNPKITRYYSFGVLAFILAFWLIVECLLIQIDDSKNKKAIEILLGFATIALVLNPFKIRNIEYIYEDEKSFIENYKENYQGIDLYVLCETHNGLYECVSLANEDTNLMVVDIDSFSEEFWPDTLITWIDLQYDKDFYSILREKGYSYQIVGTSHASVVNYWYKEETE